VASNDILKVLKESRFILILSLGLHERDLLDLTLQDKEAIVLEIDALLAQKIAHILEGSLTPINAVGAR
jgi:hypothetical protein